jgi:hypothetical protein
MGLPERAGLDKFPQIRCEKYIVESRATRSLKAPGFLLAARVQPRISQVVTRRDPP